MTRYDAIIIGGGPAGSAAAMTLQRTGRRVVVVEKETFPRFHIGESLLPYNRRLLGELGLVPLMERAGFIRKIGAQFWLGNGSKHVDFLFASGRFNEEATAWQVERSIFDDLLLKEAQRRGAEVREGCAVEDYQIHSDRVEVRTSSGLIEGRFLIDASGQGNFTGTREGLRQSNPRLRKIAIFAHFHGIPLPEGERRGDIIIVRLEHEWAWIIPLSEEKVSVGLVVDQSRFKESGLTPADMFDALVESSSVLREKLAIAKRVCPLRTISDYSYKNRRFVSPRLIRAGDAAGFMDPIFSSGVHIAMESGHAAANVIEDALARGEAFTRKFGRYEKWLRGAMDQYLEMIERFYTRPFIEVFVEPRPFLGIPSAINAILAGRLDRQWRVRWRMRVFYLLVSLRARYPLTGPVRFT